MTSPCRNGATCQNTNGSYHCICNRGYEGRDCMINTDDCASCKFIRLYVWLALKSKVDRRLIFLVWLPAPCQNGGTCLDEVGMYTCLCQDGFTGKHCETDIDECLSSPCRNGATCNQYVNSYTCSCPAGFSGVNCQTNDQDCTESSCMNNGTCIDAVNSYTCVCPAG